jgi:hypothetical protein
MDIYQDAGGFTIALGVNNTNRFDYVTVSMKRIDAKVKGQILQGG